MSKGFIVIIIAIVVGFAGIFALTKDNGDSGTSASVTPTNHVAGAGSAGVTIVEYGDFECPVCGRYFPMVESIRQKYGDQITFQFRHFPLTQTHPNAQAAHRAAESAGKQGKFFELYSILFERQSEWSASSNAVPIFEGYANELELNVDQFKSDFSSKVVNDTINADVKAGQGLGVNATPTFFINGKQIENPRDEADFDAIVAEAIARATSSTPN